MTEQAEQQVNLAQYLTYSVQSRTIQQGVYKGERKNRRKGIHHVELLTADGIYLLDKSERYHRINDFDAEDLLGRMQAFGREYAARSLPVPLSAALTPKTQALQVNADLALKFMLYNTVLDSGKSPQKLAKKAKISDYKLEKVLSFDRRSSLQRIIDVFRACGKDLKICCTVKEEKQLYLSDYLTYPMDHVFRPEEPCMTVLFYSYDQTSFDLEYDIPNCCTLREARSAVRPKLIEYFNECIAEGWNIPYACRPVDDDCDIKFMPVRIKADMAMRILLHNAMLDAKVDFKELAWRMHKTLFETVRMCCLQEPLSMNDMLKAFEAIGCPLEVSLVAKGEAEVKRTKADLDKAVDSLFECEDNYWY